MSTIAPRTTPDPYTPARTILTQAARNPALAHALTVVDGLDDAKAVHARLSAQVESMTAPEGTVDVAAELVAALTEDRAVPDDIEARYARAMHAIPAHVSLVSELSKAVHRAEDAYHLLITRALPAMLDALNSQLSDLFTTRAAALAEVSEIPDADAAIRAGLTEQWRAAQDVREEYRQVRDAQRQLLRLADDETRTLLTAHWDAACLVGNPEAWEHWDDWTRHGGTVDQHGDLTPLALPWTGHEGLAWLAAHPEARPRVPSLDAATRAAHAVIDAREKSGQGRRETTTATRGRLLAQR